MLEPKYSIIVLPAILIIASLGLDAVKVNKAAVILILFFSFFINAIFVKSLYFVPSPQQQWREVARAIMKTDKNTQIMFSNYAWYYRYYFKVYKSVNPPLEPAYADFNALLVNANSVWIVTSSRFSDSGLSADQIKSLDRDFRAVEELKFTDAIARHYIRQEMPLSKL